jgi:DNA-binding MarR family transcriptional regulator
MIRDAAAPWLMAVFEGYQPLARALQVERARRGPSSRELAALLGVGASAITPLVERLVERSFARRTDDPHDRRIARLEATRSGADLLEHLAAGRSEVIGDSLAQLEPAELATVSAAFNVLTAGLQRTTSTPTDAAHLRPKGTAA